VYKATKQEKYKAAIVKGLAFICDAQYSNGGWPQYYPLEKNYSSHITFNDDAYLGIMELLQSIHSHDSLYRFIDPSLQAKLDKVYSKGLDCIIKTQINDNGKPTAWCQQYDEQTLQPAWARKFEPPSICNKESAGLAIFLMKIKNPSREVNQAITDAILWFRESAIYNTKVVTVKAPDTVTTFRVSKTDRIVVTDSTAPKIWTRYYELKTHRPIFCDRDSKIVYSLAEVSRERRDGYAWYTYEPQKALDLYDSWIKNQK
jgi:PelA/Pel-15E family pectate lyase